MEHKERQVLKERKVQRDLRVHKVLPVLQEQTEHQG
jgi:hypothetical protein